MEGIAVSIANKTTIESGEWEDGTSILVVDDPEALSRNAYLLERLGYAISFVGMEHLPKLITFPVRGQKSFFLCSAEAWEAREDGVPAPLLSMHPSIHGKLEYGALSIESGDITIGMSDSLTRVCDEIVHRSVWTAFDNGLRLVAKRGFESMDPVPFGCEETDRILDIASYGRFAGLFGKATKSSWWGLPSKYRISSYKMTDAALDTYRSSEKAVDDVKSYIVDLHRLWSYALSGTEWDNLFREVYATSRFHGCFTPLAPYDDGRGFAAIIGQMVTDAENNGVRELLDTYAEGISAADLIGVQNADYLHR
jgi:hypothetical protein